MPEYEAMVSSEEGEGIVEVFVFPDKSFVPGAAHLDVCHCATPNSSVKIKALNHVGAKVGDIVMVGVEGRVLAGNLAKILGLPMAGVALGWMVFLLFPSGMEAWILILAGLLCGGTVGSALLIRGGRGKGPVVERIIRRAQEARDQFNESAASGRCAGCSALKGNGA